MKKMTLLVGGMSCQHCVKAVEKALLKTDGVESAHVDLAKGQAEISYDESVFDLAKAGAAINDEGYEYKGTLA